MSWYNPASWDWSGAFGIGSGDPSNQDRDSLRGAAQGAQGFGAQGVTGYGGDTSALNAQRAYLQQLATGQHSVTQEQLRQSLAQQQAQQMSYAASAAPQNQAMAARNAAMNMGRASYGMAGQQAVAGLQERNQANEALAQMNLGMRGQDANVGLGGYGTAVQGYGTAAANPQKTFGSMIGGGIGGGAAYLAKSDRRAKTDIEPGDGKAGRALDDLAAYVYRYKDTKDGEGEQLGVMAQDLERVLPQAVIDTPGGKMVHGAKLAGANTAMLAQLAKRVKKLEAK